MEAQDYMVRATAHGGLVRAFAINATGVVREIRERHQTFPSATAALGRLSIGALMFGAMLKEEDQIVTIRVQGDGPAGSLVATVPSASAGVTSMSALIPASRAVRATSSIPTADASLTVGTLREFTSA